MAQQWVTQYPDGRTVKRSSYSNRVVLTKSLYLPIALGTFLLGAIFGGLGVMLVYIGAKGTTHIKIFGQTMDTTDVGVASIFLAVVMVVLILRRLLQSVERVAALPGEGFRGGDGSPDSDPIEG